MEGAAPQDPIATPAAPAFGIVVVGAGRAGRARVREAESDPSFALRGIVSRRPEAATTTWERALADTNVHGLVLCVENDLHEPLCRAALDAGKHVLVEFPLALSVPAYHALYEHAARVGRVLHEEHIELLTPTHDAWRRCIARPETRPTRVELRSTGGWSGWIADPRRAGPTAFAAIARLHVLDDLFGPLQVLSASEHRTPDGLRLEVELHGRGELPVRWIHERREGLAHATHLSVHTAQGELPAPSPSPGQSLFAQDYRLFLSAVARGAGAAADRERNLRCAALAASIQVRCLDRSFRFAKRSGKSDPGTVPSGSC